MLRITQSYNATGAAKYFEEGLQKGDYYATQEQTIGHWHGKVAERLGLKGEVQKEAFVALCHNRQPDGTKLTPRDHMRRRVAYDFTFSVPKSISATYAITGDENIRLAFERSVEETMQQIEQHICTQRGQGKAKHYAQTGEAVWASFTHKTGRPVMGVPDCHLHRHAVLMNVTWNETQQRYQACEIGPVKQQAPWFEAAFEARLAMRLRMMGYGIDRNINAKGRYGWELAGIDAATRAVFSHRTAVVEKAAATYIAQHGILTEKQKAQLGALTREKKLVGKSYESLRQLWKSRLDDAQTKAIMEARQTESILQPASNETARRGVDQASKHLFERKSAVLQTQLQTEALRREIGETLPEQVEQAVQEGEFHQRTVGHRTYLTTPQAVREETQLLAHVRQGKGTQMPLNAHYQPQNPQLTQEQQAAIAHILNDQNTVTILAGGAGTGKTTLMKEVAQGITAGGKKFYGFAPSAAASRTVMRNEGFANADTLAQLLHNPRLQEQVKNSVIWVDEAGLIGTQDMNRLFSIARQQQARILLTGDARQHASVARGDALRLLEQEGGISVARVHTIQRQRNHLAYKRAVAMAAQGQADAALHQLDRLGWVTEIAEDRHRVTRIVRDYIDAMDKKKSVLMIAPTHLEATQITHALRQKLQQEGKVQQERKFVRLVNCHWTQQQKHDSVQYNRNEQSLTLEFHQNAVGFTKGERYDVNSHSQGELTIQQGQHHKKLPTELSARYTVYRRQSLALAIGDRIRLTKGGKTREGTRIYTGDTFTITGFRRSGDVILHTGKTLDKDYGHWNYGWVTTSHSSQGRTVDRVLIAQSHYSRAATNARQFYVSLSRGRERCHIYTDNRHELERAIANDGKRMTAREVAQRTQQRRKKSPLQPTLAANTNRKDYGKGKTL